MCFFNILKQSGKHDAPPSTFLWNASECTWNLPRTKQVSTGHLFTPPAVGPAFRFPCGYKKKNHSIWSGAARLVIDIRPQSLRIASVCQWNLPRTKKPATGRFFTSLRSAVLFDSRRESKKKSHTFRCGISFFGELRNLGYKYYALIRRQFHGG